MSQKLLLFALLTCSIAWNTAKAAETEPNDNKTQANTLILGGSQTGTAALTNEDWFAVTTTVDGQLNMSITSNNGEYVYCYLYDNNGTTLVGGGSYTNNTYNFSVDGLAPGTYYVRIYALYGNGSPTYTVSNTFTTIAQVNDVEPNGTRAQAKTLPVNGSKTGHIGYYYNLARDSADWYKVAPTADGQLTLTLTPANGQYVYLTLYDNDGTTVLGGTYSNGAFNVAKDGLAAGTYYVKINCLYASGFAPYTLSNTFVSPAQANDTEPDSTVAQALTLPLNSSVTGHVGYYYNNHRDTVDWYKVTTTSDGLLRLSLTPANGQYTYVTLYDNNGTTLLNNSYSNVAFTQSTDGLAAGTYYVRVNCLYSTGFAPYTLSDSLFSPAQANDAEPDSTGALALTLPLNGSKTGHVGYYYNNHRDSVDWYKVTTNADGQLNLSLTPANGQYVYVNLYDNNGTTLLYSTYSNNSFNFNVDGLAAGTYYVRVFCFYNYTFAPYTLSNTLTVYANAVDAESNNKAYQAKTMPANGTITGHVGFYYNNVRDSADWHKINYTGTGALTVTVNFETNKNGGYPYAYMQIWKDTLAAPVYSSYTSGPILTASLTSLTQGYYWVRVIPYYNYQFIAYNIVNTFTQTAAKISVTTADTVATCTNTNTITFKCTKSLPPYTVQLYRYGIAYGSPVIVNKTYKATNLPLGSYTATVFGDGATGAAFGTSKANAMVPPTSGTSTTNITQTSAKTNWTNLVTCAKYYSVQYHKAGDSAWITKTSTGNTGSVTLTGLTANTTYRWRVQTVDSLNKIRAFSAPTDSVSFTTATLFASDNTNDQISATAANSIGLTIYPNPATTQFRLMYNAKNLNEKVSVLLKDVNGKTVWNKLNIIASTINNTMVDVSKLPQGIYILQLTGEKNNLVQTRKIVVSR